MKYMIYSNCPSSDDWNNRILYRIKFVSPNTLGATYSGKFQKPLKFNIHMMRHIIRLNNQQYNSIIYRSGLYHEV